VSQSEEAVSYQHFGKDIETRSVDGELKQSVNSQLVLYQWKLARLQFTVAVRTVHNKSIAEFLACSFSGEVDDQPAHTL